jgi:ABC-type transporter Mla subunit MlaD
MADPAEDLNLIEVEGDPDNLPPDDGGYDDPDAHQEAERRTRKLSASYRSQTGHLTRVIERANALVTAAAGNDLPSKTMYRELEKVLEQIRAQQEKCANTCEAILESQEHLEDNDANVIKTVGCLDRDAKRGDLVAVRVTRE